MNMSLKQEAIKGFFWIATSKALQQGIAWFFSIAVARLLFPSDYGLMALANIYIYFIMYFNELSLGSAIIQRKEINEAYLSSAFWSCIFGSILIYIFSFFISGFLATFFEQKELESIIKALGVSLIIMGFGIVPSSLIARVLKFRKRAEANFLAETSMGVSSLILAYMGFGVWSLVYGAIIRSIVYCLLMYQFSHWRPKLVFSWELTWDLMKFGIPLTGSKILHTLYSNADNLIIGKVLGDRLLGFYYMAYRLSNMPVIRLTRIIDEVNFPVMSKMQDGERKIDVYFLQTTKYISILVLPILVGIFLVSYDFVAIFLSNKWLPIVLPLKMFCLIGIFRAINTTMQPLLLAKGRVDINFRYSLLSALVVIGAVSVGVNFGLLGAVVGILIVHPILTAYLLKYGLQGIGISSLDYLRTFLPSLKAVCVLALVVVFFKALITNPLLRFSGSVSLGMAAYAGYFWLVEKEVISDIKSGLFAARTKEIG